MNIRNIFYIALMITAATLSGCSYGMDLVEGAITNRAAFSIDATYNGTDTVTVTWDETSSSDQFAGYEVYMTRYAWDEYGNYEVVAANIDISDSLPDIVVSFTTIAASPALIAVLPDSTNEGEYYFRVALYKFDKKPKSEWSDPDVPEYYGDTLPADYEDHTSLISVSGFAAVDIY